MVLDYGITDDNGTFMITVAGTSIVEFRANGFFNFECDVNGSKIENGHPLPLCQTWIVYSMNQIHEMKNMPLSTVIVSSSKIVEMAKSSKSDIFGSVLLTFGSFVLFFISLGVSLSAGVLYVSLLDHFKQSHSDTSWITSLGSGLMLLFGPIAGITGKKCGIRLTSVIGSILSTIGFVTSSFVNSMYLLYITYGVIVGIGSSFMLNSANTSVNLYFDKRRNMVAGIASTGIGFGTLCLPVLGTYLLQEYDWRGTFFILAGIVLQGTCCGMLFFPISLRKETSLDPNEHDVVQDNGKSIIKEVKEILTSSKFILFTLSTACVYLMLFVPYIMLPDMVLDYGITEDSGAFMITVAGIANILSRVVIGSLITCFEIDHFILNGVSLVILGAATSCCYIIEKEYLFYIYAVIVGGTTGIFGLFQALIVGDIVEKEKLQLGFGMVTFFAAITTIGGPPAAGLITDKTGSYKTTFLCGGFVFVIGGIFSILSTFKRCSGSSGKYTL